MTRSFPTPEDAHAEAMNLLREAGINPEITIVEGFNEIGYFTRALDGAGESWNEWPLEFPYEDFRHAMKTWRLWGLS